MISNALPKSLADNPRLDQWISFREGGRVRLATGKVEIGQGILTALAQIAAEELDIDPNRLDVVSGDTTLSPSEGFTSGSNSTDVSGRSVRLASAEVRNVFLERAAEVLGCDTRELTVEDGRFLRGGSDTGRDYWSMNAEVNLARDATGSAPTKRPSEYRVVGRSLPRLDLPGKIAGAAFVHDLAPENVLHARVLHRPWRDAHLVSFDDKAVRRAAVNPVEIVREGDLVMFTSDDETAAMRAWEAARNSAVWGGGNPPAQAMTEGDAFWTLPSRDRVAETGDGPAPAGGAVVEAQYSRQHLVHASIAPSLGIAEYRDGELKVWTHSQGTFVLRDWLAKTLGLDAGRISVFHVQGAGCYGHNSADDAAFEAAWLAVRTPGRPVRVQWTREDELSVAPLGPAAAVTIRATVDEEARPADWTIEIWSPIHGRRPGMNGRANFLSLEALPGAVPEPHELKDIPDEIGGGATRNAVAYYDLPRHRLVHHMLDGVPLRTSTLRGLGAYVNTFAIESFIDELAERAGEDSVAYRLSMVADPRQRAVIEMVAEMANWPEGTSPGEGIARGIGFGRYKNTAAMMAIVAEVEVEEEVRVRRVWAAVDAGLVVNPDGAASQVEGGIVQGLSWALKEQVRFEAGRIVSDTWDTYPIMRFSEVPPIEIRFVDLPNEPSLGIGEVAHGPTAAAVGNAVATALGARIRHLPLTRERIMETLLA